MDLDNSLNYQNGNAFVSMHLIAFQDRKAQTYRRITNWFIENVSKAGSDPGLFDAHPKCIVLTLCQAKDAIHFFF